MLNAFLKVRIKRQTCREVILRRWKANAASEGNYSNYYLKKESYSTTFKDIRQSITLKLELTEQLDDKHT